MTAYCPALIERLCTEAKAHDAALRAEFPKCTCNGAAGCEDWCPCAPFGAAYRTASTWAEDNLSAMADQLEAAKATIAELEKRPLRTFDQIAADRMGDEIAVLVRRRIIDARSPAGDALLDYRDPPPTARSDRMAALEAEVERLQADAVGQRARCRLEEADRADVERAVTAERDAMRADRDHWREARRTAMEAGEVLKAERDALRAEVERMRPVVDAAVPMRTTHEGCVTDPPCGACVRCDFDRAVDAYRASEPPEVEF